MSSQGPTTLHHFGLWLDLRYRPVLWAIIGLAATLGLFRIHSQPASTLPGQTDNFWPLVNHLLDGEGYTLCYPLYFPFCPGEKAPPTAMREPVPTLLFAAAAAISGRSLLFTLHVQLLLCLGVVLLAFRFTRRMAGTRAALIAALAWAVWLPPITMIENQLSGDLAGTFFLLWSALLLQRARHGNELKWWIASGALLGVAALSRSSLIVMIVPWTAAAFWPHGSSFSIKGGVRTALITAVSVLVVMSPWAIRNKMVFGKAWLGTSMNGYNVWRMNSQVGTDEPIHYVDPWEADSMKHDLLARRTDLKGTENEAEMDRVYLQEGLAMVKKDPGKYLRLCAYRSVQLLTNLHVRETYGIRLTLVDHVTLGQQLLYLLLGFVGMWHLRRSQFLWIAAIAFHVAAYCALVAQLRYMIPVMPLVIAFGAYALERALWRRAPR